MQRAKSCWNLILKVTQRIIQLEDLINAGERIFTVIQDKGEKT